MPERNKEMPPLWWSPTHGLITRDTPEYENAPVYWRIENGRMSLRHEGFPNELPADAVALTPEATPKPALGQVEPVAHEQFKRFARDQFERLALDEYSMVWERARHKNTGDHLKAMKHVVGVLIFGDATIPEEG